jgi:hypothetical protein
MSRRTFALFFFHFRLTKIWLHVNSNFHEADRRGTKTSALATLASLESYFQDAMLQVISEAWIRTSIINLPVHGLKYNCIKACHFCCSFAFVHFDFPGYWIVRVPLSSP